MSLRFEPGKVHALVGENGAGKSTLLKILSGVYQPDEGSIRFGEREVRFGNALDSIRAGVAVIYQELHLAEHMTVAENILLGHLPTKLGVLNRTDMRKQAADILKRVGVEVDPNAMVHSLSLAQQQMVEIAKALSRDAQLIAFDEPTSSLSMKETEALFAMIEELRRQGKAIMILVIDWMRFSESAIRRVF